ncbi:MAG: hypothetical protein CM15mP9_3980 [Methanobacteriota archaeon]|nr:MAG: hypothetical protein CM15mP9_3980 [Euryarchaeota archaeon]
MDGKCKYFHNWNTNHDTKFRKLYWHRKCNLQYTLGNDESISVTSSEDITNGENLAIKYRYAFTETLFSNWSIAEEGSRIAGWTILLESNFGMTVIVNGRLALFTKHTLMQGGKRCTSGFKPLSATSDNSSYP